MRSLSEQLLFDEHNDNKVITEKHVESELNLKRSEQLLTAENQNVVVTKN